VAVSDAEELALLEIARKAASAAADELRSRFGGRAQGVQSKSSPTDLVSDADLAAEAAIREVIGRERPQDAILGEEGGETSGSSAVQGGEGTSRSSAVQTGFRWVVDPLDGTINYLFGLPVFGVSVAVEDDRGAVAGVVLDPLREECFAATRSGPATLNGSVLRGSGREELSSALVGTGFGYEAGVRARQAVVVAELLPRVRDIRRAGAAAIDLCWCACGRLDAYYERGVKAWDVAAGGLIARRAGLSWRELAATESDAWGVAVAPPGVIDELYGVVGGG
jgi:myo-inositol-1(or 4)-monophosphatase